MTPSNHPEYSKLAVNTISYFHFFHFAPSKEHIFNFFPKRASIKQLSAVLDGLVRKKKLTKHDSITFDLQIGEKKRDKSNEAHNNRLNSNASTFDLYPLTFPLYTLPQYSINPSVTIQRHIISKEKLALVYCYTKALSNMSFIKMVAVTGSAAMGNCKKNDDVDMMIVTERGYLWISRFCAIFLSVIYNVRSLVCLNLFFDESDLLIPKHKQTPYVAHEILQMKPVINKDKIYEKFIKTNKWVKKIYPNSMKLNFKFQNSKFNSNSNIKYQIVRLIESILKIIQLAIIRKNKTSLIITDTQLWLFRKDFEKKLNQNFNYISRYI